MSAAKPVYPVYDPEGPVPLSQNKQRWTVLWPAYLNRALTVAQGRRLAKDITVDNPTLQELAQVCKELNLPHVAEAKSYPRNWTQRGRLRVCLFADDGLVHNSACQNKSELLLVVSQRLQLLRNRQAALAKTAAATSVSSSAAPASAASASAPAAGSGSSKKKNKKKK